MRLTHESLNELVAFEALVDPHFAFHILIDGDHVGSEVKRPEFMVESLKGNQALLEEVENLKEGQLAEICEPCDDGLCLDLQFQHF